MPDALGLLRLKSGYGETVVLEDVDLALREGGSLSVIGRNGVGKTTLLATIMGHTTFHSGEILFNGKPIQGLPVYERARLGIGYVPQGRRVFPSLSTDEHLRMLGTRGDGAWTPDRIYELFPRLAERRKVSGKQLSGGEQQMLVIGRALQGLTAGATVLVAEDPGGKPLGFIHLVDETDYYTRRESGHIADLVVAPAARGRGVGETLIVSGSAETLRRLREQV